MSIWASVPKNTSRIEKANSTTVRRSDASTVNALRHGLGGLLAGSTLAAGAGGVAVVAVLLPVGAAVWIELFAICGSLVLHEPDGAKERLLESGLLLADQFDRPLHLEEPGPAFLGQD